MVKEYVTEAVVCRCKRCTGRFMAKLLYIGSRQVPTDYCPKCRAAVLSGAVERAVDPREKRREAEEIAAFVALLKEVEHIGDWLVIDENGVEVWARQLAKRYRKQTKPRGLPRR